MRLNILLGGKMGTMKSRAVLLENFRIIVDNGRKHSVVLDLPEELGGDDFGPTALELTVMGLSGCIATIFMLVAKKMRLNIKGLDVVVEAEKPDTDMTITKANIIVNVKTDESKEKIERALKITLDTCPVGVLFKRANVQSSVTLNVTE